MTGVGGRGVLGHLSWQGLSMAVLAISQVVVTAVLARFLTPSDFGVVAAANIVITLVQMLAEGGMGAAIVQRKQLDSGFVTASFILAFAIAAVAYAALLGLALPYERMLGIEGTADVMYALGVGFFMFGLGGVCEGLMQRELGFRSLFRINFASSLVGYAVPAVVLAFAGFGVWALVIATITRMATRLVLLYGSVRGRVVWLWDWDRLKEVGRFGFGLSQDRFWNWVTAQAPPFLIGQQLGQDLLGKFYLGNQLAVLPGQHASTVLSSVFLPIMSRARDDRDAVARIFLPLLAVSFVLMSLIGLFLSMNARAIVQLVLGPGWEEAVPVFQVLCLAAGVRSGIQISDALNVASGKVYSLAYRRGAVAVLLALLLTYTVSAGLASVATVIVASQITMLGLTGSLAFSSVKGARRDGPSVLRPLLVSIALVGGVNALLWIGQLAGVGGVTVQMTVGAVVACGLVVAVLYLFRDCMRVVALQSAPAPADPSVSR